MAVQGGASGAIIVKGIENVQPKVAGLPERVLVIRDQPVPDVRDDRRSESDSRHGTYRLTTCRFSIRAIVPAVIQMGAKEKQFWRVVNAAADTIIDLQLKYDKQVQPLQLVSLDGVPIGSQDGARKGRIVNPQAHSCSRLRPAPSSS